MGLGTLRVIGASSTIMAGEAVKEDLRFTWSRDHKGQTAEAERIFKEYVSGGWLAIGEVSGKKMQIFTFDPDLDEIILAPFALGG